MNQDVADFRSLTMPRRRLLGSAAGIAAAAAVNLIPPNERRALAQGAPGPGSLRDIKHVVLLMQENRSFDHYFGTLAGTRGFGDPTALTLSSGRSVFYQPDPANPKGYLLPFEFPTARGTAMTVAAPMRLVGPLIDGFESRPTGTPKSKKIRLLPQDLARKLLPRGYRQEVIMDKLSEIRVTVSDELLDVLQAQARILRVPLRWVIASLVCDTIETAVVPDLIPALISA